jgi:hypothetical protein
MTDSNDQIVASNPFATRFTRPGALRYHFAPEVGCDRLLDRLAAEGWRGAIVGPHGSGKTTLLSTLELELAARGRVSHRVTLHAGQHQLPYNATHRAADPRLVLVIDGYEQLGVWPRWRLSRQVQAKGWGLLVTCHSPLGLPVIHHTTTDPELAVILVRELLGGYGEFISDDDVRRAFAEQEGDMRETLFTLYDIYELRSRATKPR